MRGIAPERVIFAPRTVPDSICAASSGRSLPRYASLQRHTTASDALWMGLPLVTCPAMRPGRVATSLLHAIGIARLGDGFSCRLRKHWR